MNTGNRACLFIRSDRPNIECQRQRLTAIAQQKAMVIAHEIVECGSACTDPRPCIDELLLKAEAGEFDIVLVTKISRIARRTNELMKIIYRLRNVGVEIWTADTGQCVPDELISIWEKLTALL